VVAEPGRARLVCPGLCQAGWVASFERLVNEAMNAPFSGWDFSWLGARSTAGTLPWNYRREVARRAAGLAVETAVRGEQRYEFHDIAAVVYYLRVVSWAIPGFSLDACAASLRAAHDTPQMWPVPVRQRRFLLIATKTR